MRTSSSPARSTVALAGEEAAPVADVVRAALLPAEAVAARRLREDERGKTGCRKDRETLHRSSRIDEVYRVVERRRFSSAQTTAPTFQEPLLILLCFLEHALFLAAHLGRHLAAEVFHLED